MNGYINKIIPFSSVDGPGNRTAIFLQGCNFNCIYCHNPETINHCSHCSRCVEVCGTNALSVMDGKVVWDKSKCCNCDQCISICNNDASPKILTMTVDEVMAQVMNYRPFIQGITVSGGECTLQQEFLIELFKKAREVGLTCFIDSNGSSDFRKMPELMEVCTGVMLDVKVWNIESHNKYINFSNKNVLSNLEYLISIDKLYEVRTVVVPNIFDNKETIFNVSKAIGESGLNIRYKIIEFRPMGVRDSDKVLLNPSANELKILGQIARDNGCKNVIIV